MDDNSCTVCNLCEAPGTLDDSPETAQIPSVARVLAGQTYTVWRCRHCGSLHSAEAVDLDYCYAHYAVKDHAMDFHTRLGYRNRLRDLKRHGVTAADHVLDFGCGAGLFVDFLRGRGFPRVSGYDPYVERFADSAALAHTYDTVVSYDVIEHYDDPKQFLDDVVRLVKPGGLLVLGTPNASTIRLDELDEFFMDLHQPYHRHILSEPQLLSLVSSRGLVAEGTVKKSHWDTVIPTVNSRFIWHYCYLGGDVDTVIGPPNFRLVCTRPRLMMYALFGFCWPTRGSLTAFFRRS